MLTCINDCPHRLWLVLETFLQYVIGALIACIRVGFWIPVVAFFVNPHLAFDLGMIFLGVVAGVVIFQIIKRLANKHPRWMRSTGKYASLSLYSLWNVFRKYAVSTTFPIAKEASNAKLDPHRNPFLGLTVDPAAILALNPPRYLPALPTETPLACQPKNYHNVGLPFDHQLAIHTSPASSANLRRPWPFAKDRQSHHILYSHQSIARSIAAGRSPNMGNNFFYSTIT
jgi:hypothetical protein